MLFVYGLFAWFSSAKGVHSTLHQHELELLPGDGKVRTGWVFTRIFYLRCKGVNLVCSQHGSFGYAEHAISFLFLCHEYPLRQYRKNPNLELRRRKERRQHIDNELPTELISNL